MLREVDGQQYIYTYYVDWAGQQRVRSADQIYLARARISNARPEPFEYFTASGFKKALQPGDLKAVVEPPEPKDKFLYAALPSVSFNNALNKLLMVFETERGFCATTSEDGVTWGKAEVAFPFDRGQQKERRRGDTWYSYPTLMSPSEPTDQTTSNSGFLYASKGRWEVEPHQPVRFPFTIR